MLLLLLLLLLLLVMLWWIEVRRYWLLLVVLISWLLVKLLLLLGVGIWFRKIPVELYLEWNQIYHFKFMFDDKHMKSQITKKEEQKEIDILFYLLCHIHEMCGLPTPRMCEVGSATFCREAHPLPPLRQQVLDLGLLIWCLKINTIYLLFCMIL